MSTACGANPIVGPDHLITRYTDRSVDVPGQVASSGFPLWYPSGGFRWRVLYTKTISDLVPIDSVARIVF